MTIIGVGLLGGSLALALKAAGAARTVVGVGRRRARLEAACRAGVIDEATTELRAGCDGAQVVVVATPVDQIATCVVEVHRQAQPQLITDVGSTKASIVAAVQAAAPDAPFVGSHPLAGRTTTGFEAAESGLFRGRTVFLTPVQSTPRSCTALAATLWEKAGGRVEVVTPEEHDRIVALTSHLPHVVASALAAMAPDWPAHHFGTGWRSTTRLAAGAPAMWRAILQENRPMIVDCLRQFEQVLRQWTEALEREDWDMLARLLEEGRKKREGLGD